MNERELHQDESSDELTLVCVGKFDRNGVPLFTSRHLSQHATVTFQGITIAQMVSRLVKSEVLKTGRISHEDGSVIRLEHSPEGFVAYLESR
jgi:hypothetical protein